MARYMGGPRGRREHSPTSRAPSSPTNQENTVSADEEYDAFESEEDEASSDQYDGGPLHRVQLRESIQVRGNDDDDDDVDDVDYPQDGAYDDFREEFGTEGSEIDEMDVDDVAPSRVPNQHRQIRGVTSEGPLFPRLPITSRNIDDVEDDDNISVLTDGHLSKHSMRLRQRQRKPTPGIDIEYTNPKGSGSFIFEPLPLPILYGWMVKGTKEHVEDIHLSGVLFCDNEVHSKRAIEVLCEYTWICPTPSQDKTTETCPAIYVPGNTRGWQGLKLGSSLNHADLCGAVSRAIRDEHAFLQPQYPYEPTFRALEVTNADFSFRGVDIVTDADTLTRLLAFICGSGASGTQTMQPFRLDLSTVRDTLFVIPKEKPGRGHAGPLPKRERSNPMTTVPEWAAHVLGRKGSNDPRLPYSGGHYRLIRYRFGNVVLAVRVKVEFVYEHRKAPARPSCDPLYGITPEVVSASILPDGMTNWKTTVKAQGLGTSPGAAGMATVRYTSQDRNAKLNEMMPQLWFSRTPFLVEGVVAYPTLEIKDASLVNSQQYYKSFERGHRCSLRHLAGLLKHLQTRTRELGGNAVMICDPVQVCFVILKPVMNTKPVPEDIALQFWGPDDNSVHASDSDLTEFSKTPTPPQGSNFLDTGEIQNPMSTKTKKNPETVDGNGFPTKANHQQVEDIGPVNMAGGWDVHLRQSVEDEGYEPDIENNTNHPLAGGHDGYTTDNDQVDDDIIMGESTHEEPYRPSASSGDKPFEDDGQENDYDGLAAGGQYQQKVLSKERGSCHRENSDEHYSGDSSDQMQHRYAIEISHRDDSSMERMGVRDIDNDEVSGDNGTLVVGAHQERRRSSPDQGNSLNLDGAATPAETHGAATPFMD